MRQDDDRVERVGWMVKSSRRHVGWENCSSVGRTLWLSGRVRYLPPEMSQARIPLYPLQKDLEQVLHSQLNIAHRRVNSYTVNSVVGRACEWLMLREAL